MLSNTENAAIPTARPRPALCVIDQHRKHEQVDAAQPICSIVAATIDILIDPGAQNQ
jgi:hypothetical protein